MNQCEIIRDLLPLYHDNACSAASRAAVERHIEGCGACRAFLGAMEAPLPAPGGGKPEAGSENLARMREAKRRLVRRAALSVLAAVTAMGLLAAGGAALYTEFELARPLGYTDRLVGGITQGGGGGEIRLNVKRYDSVQCLLRRVTIGGEARDIACILLRQTWARAYLDWSAVGGPEMVALGAGTGLSVSRGGRSYEAYYGYEYEPELWNPNWAYPGHVTQIYYWEGSDSFPYFVDIPEEEFLPMLEQDGILLWEEGDSHA